MMTKTNTQHLLLYHRNHNQFCCTILSIFSLLYTLLLHYIMIHPLSGFLVGIIIFFLTLFHKSHKIKHTKMRLSKSKINHTPRKKTTGKPPMVFSVPSIALSAIRHKVSYQIQLYRYLHPTDRNSHCLYTSR